MSKDKHYTRKEIDASVTKLQRLGFIGETKMINGQKHVRIGPEHLSIMLEILRHPEKWPDHWSDEHRAQWYAARDQAITKGLIEP